MKRLHYAIYRLMIPELRLFGAEERNDALRSLYAYVSKSVWAKVFPAFGVVACVSAFILLFLWYRFTSIVIPISLGLFAGIASVCATVWVLRRTTRRLVRSMLNESGHHLCLNCGYDLRESSSGICPECGQSIRFKDLRKSNTTQR